MIRHSVGGFVLINALIDRATEMGRHLRGAMLLATLDKTTPPLHTDTLHAGIRGSRVVRVAERGHLLNWEAPDVIIDEVVKLAS